MLPTNTAKGQGCNPVSSNCVIWQGPDIPCIDLCKGDSITDVTYKLATELCEIMCTLDINTYDLTCFQPICPTPESFHDLVQFMITKLCELQCCCDQKSSTESTPCPDTCVVTVAPCFYYVNQIGDTVTTMTLTEYAQAIGNKLCQLIGQISTDNARINNLDTVTTSLGNRVTSIENQLPSAIVTLPSSCLMGAPPEGGWPIGPFVQNLETSFCNLQTATGEPIDLLLAIQKQCANLDNLKTLTNRSTTYSGLLGWVTQTNYATVADSINNMWLTICDMRSAIENILKTCCCTDCDDVNISFTATVAEDVLTLYFTGSIPTGLTDCFPSGNLITITDGDGGSYVTYVEVVNNLNSSVEINLSGTPINPATDLTLTIQGCWNRPAPGSDCGGLRCERVLTYTIVNTAPCPTLALDVDVTEVDYSFTNTVAGPVTYTIELYTGGGVFVSSQTSVNPAFSDTVSGTFSSLTGGTNYYILVKVLINDNTKTCPQAFFTTEPYPCAAPTSVSATNVT